MTVGARTLTADVHKANAFIKEYACLSYCAGVCNTAALPPSPGAVCHRVCAGLAEAAGGESGAGRHAAGHVVWERKYS